MPVLAFFVSFYYALFFFLMLFCGIILVIMKKNIFIFSILTAVFAMPAFAGWQYDGYYVNDGYYVDDGSRFVVGFRGGLSMASAKMKNEIGSLSTGYMMSNTTDSVVSVIAWENQGEPEGYSFAGYGDLGKLPVNGDLKGTVFTAGASIGLTLPNRPQWRIEAGYDYITEIKYNKRPLLEGNLALEEGNASVVHVSSTSAESTVSTDVVSLMAYYDFFEGNEKRLDKFIPYVGFGVGYAVSKTVLKLTDTYGDLSYDPDLIAFGTLSNNIIQFDNPSNASAYPSSTNLALIGALGVSYGVAKSTFIDASLRLMYLPKVTWNIANAKGTVHREWFAAEDMFYTNLMIGLRFEF